MSKNDFKSLPYSEKIRLKGDLGLL